MKPTNLKQVAAELTALDGKVNALLPARYQHCYTEVSPSSMGSAGLIYGPDGRVAWEQIWTTFCDLALAGGPPHRGKLLEAVTEADVAAQPDRQAEVLAEIGRAIGLTTSLPVAAGDAPGWIGVRCQTLAEAAWLQFAVTAENVSARRRQEILQLPAGPTFRVEKEIKNVVVALAKSYHYWDGHLTSDQQSLAGDSTWEPATPNESSSNPVEYEAAIAELERGLHAAGRPTTPRNYVGWVGIETAGDEEAVWQLRAILAEGVLARREEGVIYLPVGAKPDEELSGRVIRAASQALRLWRVSPEARNRW